MKILVCGSRTFNLPKVLRTVLDGMGVTTGDTIITGDAQGADNLAVLYARENNILYRVYNADWKGLGKSAGLTRNSLMLREENPAYVVAFWDGKSRGTLDTITKAVQFGVKEVIIIPFKRGPSLLRSDLDLRFSP